MLFKSLQYILSFSPFCFQQSVFRPFRRPYQAVFLCGHVIDDAVHVISQVGATAPILGVGDDEALLLLVILRDGDAGGVEFLR